MKIRNGFVSNSSSSSFLISYPNFKNLSVEDMKKQFKEEMYYWDDSECCKELEKKFEKEIAKGRAVLFVDLDYDSEETLEVMKRLFDVVVLWRE